MWCGMMRYGDLANIHISDYRLGAHEFVTHVHQLVLPFPKEIADEFAFEETGAETRSR